MLIACVAIALNHNSFGQHLSRRTKPQWGYGAAIIYDFEATGWGAALRVKIPVIGKLSAVPEFSYFPSFNDYHEYYAGAAVHYELFTLRTYNFYPLIGAYYNNWINAEEYATQQRKQHNFAPEAGAGLVRNRGCIRPFIEYRYDFKWKENNLRLGIYWYPGACGKGKPRRKENCPVVTHLNFNKAISNQLNNSITL